MEPRELIERLVPLIPPPRAHQVRYHGILAPAASLRDRIVPCGEPPGREAGSPTRRRSQAPYHSRIQARATVSQSESVHRECAGPVS